MQIARTATLTDLPSLLELFRASDVSPVVEPPERADSIWTTMLELDNVTVFVSNAGERLVATATLITAPNLLRHGRGHGFLENVVTHPGFQGRGHGAAVVRAALSKAWETDCHHVLLQSGRADAAVHRFYENCGFEPGLRIGYVAHRPK